MLQAMLREFLQDLDSEAQILSPLNPGQINFSPFHKTDDYRSHRDDFLL